MSKIEVIAKELSSHIKKPMTADEIAAYLDSFDYSAELALQHLLLLFADMRKQFAEYVKAEELKECAIDMQYCNASNKVRQLRKQAKEVLGL